MKRIYGEAKDWNERNWKKSFENLANDGYDYEQLDFVDWFICKMEYWKLAVLNHRVAKKIIKETEKAIQFSIVNQYGSMYEIWFPKSVIIK